MSCCNRGEDVKIFEWFKVGSEKPLRREKEKKKVDASWSIRHTFRSLCDASKQCFTDIFIRNLMLISNGHPFAKLVGYVHNVLRTTVT
jgi:hypothetical protein